MQLVSERLNYGFIEWILCVNSSLFVDQDFMNSLYATTETCMVGSDTFMRNLFISGERYLVTYIFDQLRALLNGFL